MKMNKKNIVKLNLISIGGNSQMLVAEIAPEIPLTLQVPSTLGWMGHSGFRIGNGVRFFRGLK